MEARPPPPLPTTARHLATDNTALDNLREILLTNGEQLVVVPMPSKRWYVPGLFPFLSSVQTTDNDAYHSAKFTCSQTLCQLAALTFSFNLRTNYPFFYLQLPDTNYQLNKAEIPPFTFRSLKERDILREEVLARGGDQRVVEGIGADGEDPMLGFDRPAEGVGGDEEGMLGLDRAFEGFGEDGEEEAILEQILLCSSEEESSRRMGLEDDSA
ncbi:hypothetical protein CF326_g8537 [Tilletia indica]|nr:hypothetical protein CF326_g8537 [Tilletia indica]